MGKIRKSKYMKDELELRSFQQDAILKFIKKKRGLISLPTGLGKTITSIALYTYVKEKLGKVQLIFITEKSVVPQVKDDIESYFIDIKTQMMYEDTKKARWGKLGEVADGNVDVTIMNYDPFRRDFKALAEAVRRYGKKGGKVVVVYDEATALKNENSKTHQFALELNRIAYRSYGLTATPSKGNLEDIFYILRSLRIKTWGKGEFVEKFVVAKSVIGATVRTDKKLLSQSIGVLNKKTGDVLIRFSLKKLGYQNINLTATSKKRGKPMYNIKMLSQVNQTFQVEIPYHYVDNKAVYLKAEDVNTGKWRHIKVWTYEQVTGEGYTNFKEFIEGVKPYIFSKSKRSVAKELPKWTVKRYYVQHDKKTLEAIGKIYFENSMLNYSQINASLNCPQIYHDKVPKKHQNPKIKQLISLLRDSLGDEKVLIYTPNRSVINTLLPILKEELPDDKFAKVTGEIVGSDREAEKQKFYDDHRIMLLNDAGIRGLNLQVAEHIVVLTHPSTGSDMLQLMGRLSRIGTKASKFVLHFILTEDSADIDWHRIIFGQLMLLQKITPDAMEDGILDNIPKHIGIKPIDEEKSDIYLKSRLSNRRDQYIKHYKGNVFD